MTSTTAAGPPTTPTRARTDREARRLRLLDASVRAIRSAGADVSMAQIAETAGVSKPVLYSAFVDKAGLAAALADRFLGELDRTLADTVTAAMTPRDVMRTTIGAFVAFAEREPELYRFLVDGAEGTGRDCELPMLASLAARIGDFLTGPVARIDDPGRAPSWAQAIMGMVYSTVGWWLEGGARSRDQVVDDLTDLICGGLAAAGVDTTASATAASPKR